MEFVSSIPTTVAFGQGFLHSLHEQALPGKKALIVISGGKTAVDQGYVDIVKAQLAQANVSWVVCTGNRLVNTNGDIVAGAEMARDHQCDFVLGLGGGRVLDGAKAIGFAATNEGNFWDYMVFGTGKGRIPKHAPLPVVCIPTTAGSGAEINARVFIAMDGTGEVGAFSAAHMEPFLSVIDPALTLCLPPDLTAYHGLSALFNSAAGYVSRCSNPMSDLYALTAIKAIGRHLPEAVGNGGSIDARSHVALASLMGGMATSIASFTGHHALALVVSASCPQMPYSKALAATAMGYYTHLANSGVADQRLVDMARSLGNDKANRAMDFLDAIAGLGRMCGVPVDLPQPLLCHAHQQTDMIEKAQSLFPACFACDPVPLPVRAARFR